MHLTPCSPRRAFLFFAGSVLLLGATLPDLARAANPPPAPGERRLLYVAVPGIRNYLEFGGHGVLVFDIDRGHAFVRRIPAGGMSAYGQPLNVKGIAANAATRRLYVSTPLTLTAFDLLTDRIVWEKPYDGGCDRMALSPDGKTMYLPSFEREHWNVIDPLSGEVLARVGLASKKWTADSGRFDVVFRW